MNRTRIAARARDVFPFVFALALISPIASAQDVCMEAHVHPHDPFPFKNFGRAVDVSGDTAIVGAMWDNENDGAAYTFEFNGETWVQIQKLLASDTEPDDFGRDVAIDGDTIVVAAVTKGYVFTRNDDQWIEQQHLIPKDAPSGFGNAIAIHNDVIVIGSMHDDTQGSNAGAAWVFRNNGSTWIEEQKLLASDGSEGDLFGSWPAVDVHGDFIAIGAPGHDVIVPPGEPPSNINAGAAYVFHYDGQTWIEQQIFSPFNPKEAPVPLFGWALALNGGRLAVGNPTEYQLSVFVFQYEPNREQWVKQQMILPPPEGVPAGFGRAIDLENNTLLIGDWLSTSGSGGAAFVYRFDDKNLWQLENTLSPEPNAWTNFFGRDVALDNGRAIIGAIGEDQQSGGAYMFNINTSAGDLDCDGLVGVSDLLQLLSAWGQCADANDCPADLDANGEVDTNDLLILLGEWG